MIISFFCLLGEFGIFVKDTLSTFLHIYKRRAICVIQFKKIGYDSLILIVVTSAFTGLVSALQASYLTKGFVPDSLISVMVSKMAMVELAPVLTSLVFAGKVGATISAEIGSMKVTEQLEALETMSVNVHEYIYMPKLFATLIMLPLLTIVSIFITIVFAFAFSNQVNYISSYTFFSNMKSFFDPLDLWIGLTKSFFFGFLITNIANFNGSKTENGAEGVGKATTNTVVYSSIGILMMDFLVARLFL